MTRQKRPRRTGSRPGLSVAIVAVASALATACAAGPTVPAEEATAHARAWLPGAEVVVTGQQPDATGSVVSLDASGEAVRFRFAHDVDRWEPEGMVVGGRALPFEETKAAWLDIVRTPRSVTLAQLAAGERPTAPLEVLVGGLRVASISEERLELRSIADPELGPLNVNGRHFDNLPIEVGAEIAIQLQSIAATDEGWVPERTTLANELMVELEPMDITLLALLKLRLGDRVIPVPYAIPDMAHDHGDGTAH